MKALFFYKELFMGSMEIFRPMPEMLFPVSKNLSGVYGGYDTSPIFPDPSKDKTFVKLSYRLVDKGRDHAIYKLDGFEE